MADARILVVDDEPAIRDMIAVALEVAGFECLHAENARAAHALIIDKQPDLVLLDWMLPETSGLELLRRLRRDELTANLLVILLTAKTEEDNQVQGLDAGADDYIAKPFSPRALIARIRALLRRREQGASETPIEVQGLAHDPVSHRCDPRRRAGCHGADGIPAAGIFPHSPGPGLLPRPDSQPRLGRQRVHG